MLYINNINNFILLDINGFDNFITHHSWILLILIILINLLFNFAYY